MYHAASKGSMRVVCAHLYFELFLMLSIGQQFQHYEILEELGRAGDNTAAIQRFKKEAKLAESPGARMAERNAYSKLLLQRAQVKPHQQ